MPKLHAKNIAHHMNSQILFPAHCITNSYCKSFWPCWIDFNSYFTSLGSIWDLLDHSNWSQSALLHYSAVCGPIVTNFCCCCKGFRPCWINCNSYFKCRIHPKVPKVHLGPGPSGHSTWSQSALFHNLVICGIGVPRICAEGGPGKKFRRVPVKNLYFCFLAELCAPQAGNFVEILSIIP